MIGDDIEVTVVDIRGDKVRLGLMLLKEISVHRKEVYDAIRRDKPPSRKAGGSVGDRQDRRSNFPGDETRIARLKCAVSSATASRRGCCG